MKRNYQTIDYASSSDKRIAMTNYLRIGPFQQISGRIMQGKRIYRRRVILSIIALTFLVLGLYGVFHS